ncbi:membrane hypothetical protein [Clostridium neonatale]|nr:membrane hypothetical protein [Clostridium neonatale]CAI3567430.1 membrane hypothetical protein [Clostridium neonatale]CAI3601585.1 membrane hypothetical protein [Clostridium neonatale]CAI3604859.1 membrane hypothetical protein [Clostridium neonatale]CAI3608873.1 membrane hypothetical protein [Clostridium neonatale]
MPGIYFFSLLIFFSFFINGYKKIYNKSICKNKKIVIILAMIAHMLFMILSKKMTYVCLINSIFNILTGYIIYRFSLRYMNEKKSSIVFCKVDPLSRTT